MAEMDTKDPSKDEKMLGSSSPPDNDRHSDDDLSIQKGDLLNLESIDPALNARMFLINNAIDEIGFTGYQMKLFFLNGFGYAVDSLILLIQSIIATQAAYEFQPKWRYGMTCAVYVGMLVGALFWGLSADIIGRKYAFNISLMLSSVFCIVAGAAPNWIVLGLFVSLAAFGSGGNLVLDTTVFLEYLPSRHQWLLTLLACWWGAGQFVAGMFAIHQKPPMSTNVTNANGKEYRSLRLGLPPKLLLRRPRRHRHRLHLAQQLRLASRLVLLRRPSLPPLRPPHHRHQTARNAQIPRRRGPRRRMRRHAPIHRPSLQPPLLPHARADGSLRHSRRSYASEQERECVRARETEVQFRGSGRASPGAVRDEETRAVNFLDLVQLDAHRAGVSAVQRLFAHVLGNEGSADWEYHAQSDVELLCGGEFVQYSQSDSGGVYV